LTNKCFNEVDVDKLCNFGTILSICAMHQNIFYEGNVVHVYCIHFITCSKKTDGQVSNLTSLG